MNRKNIGQWAAVLAVFLLLVPALLRSCGRGSAPDRPDGSEELASMPVNVVGGPVSGLKEEPGVTAHTEQSAYRNGDGIWMVVTNNGSRSFETDKDAGIQMWYGGEWCWLKTRPIGIETANLGGLALGETERYWANTNRYGDDLLPGRYRAVLWLVPLAGEEDTYVFAEFDVVE